MATLLTFAQPLLVTLKVSSLFVLPALVVEGLMVATKPPRVTVGEMAVGVVKGAPLVPAAEPLKLNGLVVPVLLME